MPLVCTIVRAANGKCCNNLMRTTEYTLLVRRSRIKDKSGRRIIWNRETCTLTLINVFLYCLGLIRFCYTKSFATTILQLEVVTHHVRVPSLQQSLTFSRSRSRLARFACIGDGNLDFDRRAHLGVRDGLPRNTNYYPRHEISDSLSVSFWTNKFDLISRCFEKCTRCPRFGGSSTLKRKS